MKTSEVRELTDQELIERIDTEQVKLVRLRMNHAVSPLDNPLQLKFARRVVARLKTEKRSRELNENMTSK
ncbi:MAG: 50S ribosomal protein L29 [Bacteroidales bacterium]|nr:50S ribosomal protein L29 [Bacteroidales bacterium]